MKKEKENEKQYVIVRRDGRYLGAAGWVADIDRAFNYPNKDNAYLKAKGYNNVTVTKS